MTEENHSWSPFHSRFPEVSVFMLASACKKLCEFSLLNSVLVFGGFIQILFLKFSVCPILLLVSGLLDLNLFPCLSQPDLDYSGVLISLSV